MTQTRPDRRRFLALTGAALAAPSLLRAAGVEHIGGTAFGTSWQITAPTGSGLDRLRPRVDALFQGIDAEMSPWRPDSAISRVNTRAGAITLSPDLATVTGAALTLAQASAGHFDPTVGPLVARWGFGPIEGDPAPAWSDLALNGRTLTKPRAGLTLDLCGIAKGWALDRTGDLLREAGLDSFLFDLGGEVLTHGTHPDGRDWQVAVDHPTDPAPWGVLRAIPGTALATSGRATQSYSLAGRNYSHIIDPETAEPVAGRLAAVTVRAPTAMDADGWATALFAAGDHAGPQLARNRHIDALFLIETPGGGLRHAATGGIEEALL